MAEHLSSMESLLVSLRAWNSTIASIRNVIATKSSGILRAVRHLESSGDEESSWSWLGSKLSRHVATRSGILKRELRRRWDLHETADRLLQRVLQQRNGGIQPRAGGALTVVGATTAAPNLVVLTSKTRSYDVGSWKGSANAR
uniref:Uncharacterized protein n=2 Tax=Lotharella globosa TaxID=91324 RepID=A0A7S3YSS6_9EUKA